VVLQDVQNLSSLANAGSATAGSTLEVDQEGSRLLSRAHHVDDSIQHESEVVDLAVAVLCVLLARVKVQTGTSIDVVAHDNLFTRLILGRNIISGEGVSAILASPGQSSLQALEGTGNIPLGSAEVAKETLAGQPHALVFCDRLIRGIFECVARNCGPCRDGREYRSVLGLLIGSQGCRRARFALGQSDGQGSLDRASGSGVGDGLRAS
jgi:hypothetical protein